MPDDTVDEFRFWMKQTLTEIQNNIKDMQGSIRSLPCKQHGEDIAVTKVTVENLEKRLNNNSHRADQAWYKGNTLAVVAIGFFTITLMGIGIIVSIFLKK